MNFSCIRINSVKIMDVIVTSHVDVSSCGMSLRGGYVPVFNLKG